MRPSKIKVGDRITFKAATRSHFRQATRKVTEIDHHGRPCVRYHGWSNFIVEWSEVLAVHKEESVAA